MRHFGSMLLILAVCFTLSFPALGTGDVYAASTDASGRINSSGGACLRAHTTTDSAQLALISNKTRVTIIREVFEGSSTKDTSRWYYVSVSGRKGYIRADLIGSISYAGIPAVTTAKVNYRTGPGKNMTKKGSLSKGKAITVQSEAKMKGNSQKWYRASINGTSYYLSAEYVKFQSAAVTTQPKAASAQPNAAVSAKPAAPAVSDAVLAQITVKDPHLPTVLEAGKGFLIKGTITSPQPMSRVTIGVVDASGKWVISGNYDINSTSFDMLKADKDIVFRSLQSGNYTYRVDVTVGGRTVTKINAPFQVTASAIVAGLLKSPADGGKARYVGTFDSSNCTKLFSITGFSKAVVPQGMTFTGSEYYIVYGMNPMQAIVTYSASGKKIKSGGFAFNIGHPNGITWDPETKLCYIFKGNQQTIYTWNPATNKYGKSKTPYSSSGVAYDKTTREIYATSHTGVRVYSADGRFSHKKMFKRCSHGIKHYIQDCGAQDGFIFHGISGSNKHKTNFLDVYRASDGKYLGSIRIAIGEIESVVIGNDGYVQLLVNNPTRTDYVWKTPLNINDLKK